MSLQAPIKVQKLQQTLHAKAKESPDFRCYARYDKIYREDILAHAYRLARSNGGAPGVDGEDFPDIEAYGVERWLGEMAQALKEKRYRARPMCRVYIPEPNGRQRPPGNPRNPRSGGPNGSGPRAGTDLAAARQSVHAPLSAGVENIGFGRTSAGPDHQFCR